MNTSDIIKRGGPSVEPHELTIVTDPDDPLYDRRLHLPISDEALINLAAVGQVQPIAVRPRGMGLVIVDGLQRWKRATVINMLTARQGYAGEVSAIHEAYNRCKASDLGRRIIELCPAGIKLRVSVFRADEKEAQRAKASANEFREQDPVSEKARKAQQMSRHGLEDEEIAQSFGVSGATIQRWLALDVDRPKDRKKRGKATRPSRKRIAEVAKFFSDHARTDASIAMQWALGLGSDDELIKALQLPNDIEAAFKAAKKAKAK